MKLKKLIITTHTSNFLSIYAKKSRNSSNNNNKKPKNDNSNNDKNNNKNDDNNGNYWKYKFKYSLIKDPSETRIFNNGNNDDNNESNNNINTIKKTIINKIMILIKI